MINPVALLIRAALVAAAVFVGATIVRNVTDAMILAVGGHTWNVSDGAHRPPHDGGAAPQS